LTPRRLAAAAEAAGADFQRIADEKEQKQLLYARDRSKDTEPDRQKKTYRQNEGAVDRMVERILEIAEKRNGVVGTPHFRVALGSTAIWAGDKGTIQRSLKRLLENEQVFKRGGVGDNGRKCIFWHFPEFKRS
jgi:hypothetical protein